MKKLKCLFLPLALIISAVFIFASCAKDPQKYEWYIDSYIKDGVLHDQTPASMKLDHFSVCATDIVKINFGGDGSFTFVDYAGKEHKGTFSSNKKRASVAYKITLNFESGETVTAECLSPTGTESLLEANIFGVEYTFSTSPARTYTSDEHKNELSALAIHIRDLSRSEEQISEYKDSYYYKGVIEEREGKFYLTYAGIEHNLSDGRIVYPYYIDEKDSLSKKESLSAGECIIRESRGSYAVYYYSANETYIRESVGFSEIYDWAKDLTVYDISEISYVYDKGSIAPGHLQEAKIASFAECEAIINYITSTKLTYVPESDVAILPGAPTDFLIISTDDGDFYKFELCDYYSAYGYSYKTDAKFPTLADRGTNYVNIDTHLAYKEIFSYGEKVSNTNVDLSYVILEPITQLNGINFDFTTDCVYKSDVTVNVIDKTHVQYDGVLYEVAGEYDFSGCFISDTADKYSLISIKDIDTDNVLFTVKYDTGIELSADEIFKNILYDEIFLNATLYLDKEKVSEFTSLTLSSNTTLYVSQAASDE